MKKLIAVCVAVMIVFMAGCTLSPENNRNEQSTADENVTTGETETLEAPLIPLLAENKENDIHLYGIRPRGVVLYVGREGHYYDWEYSFSESNPIRIGVGSFKYGSENDIAIISPSDSGEDMRIITNGKYNDEDIYTVDKSLIDYYISKQIEYSYDNETVTFTFDGNNYLMDISESFDKPIFGGVSFSDNVRFEFADGKIYVNVIPVIVSGDSETVYGKVDSTISVRAELVFDGSYISLADFSVRNNIGHG